MSIPEWVLKYKKEGTAIHKIRGHYYLYKITSKWDKKLKRAKKITGEYLGKITEGGLVEPSYKRNKPSSCKEYGCSIYLYESNKEIIERLKVYFPHIWKEIFIMSALRLIHKSCLKHIEFHYEDSWFSEVIKGVGISKNTIGKVLKEIGRDREGIVGFLKGFIGKGENLLIDLTHIFSLSEGMVLRERGYNSEWDFTPQVNLLFIFSYDKKMPLYYRVMAGNVRDVASIKKTIEESGIEDVVIIGDKGFHSEENIRLLEGGGLRYILPLRRNNRLIDYKLIKGGKKEDLEGYFKYQKRFIWYYRIERDGKVIWVYLDERLKVEEEQDYLGRIETHPEEGYTRGNFHKISYKFGTIALLTNICDLSAEEIFKYFKSRSEIEQMFDTYKNTLKADISYMRNDYSLEGWFFINYLALTYYYKIYRELLKNNILKEYSVGDVLLYLMKIRKVKISGHWITLEIPKQTRKLINELKLPIT